MIDHLKLMGPQKMVHESWTHVRQWQVKVVNWSTQVNVSKIELLTVGGKNLLQTRLLPRHWWRWVRFPPKIIRKTLSRDSGGGSTTAVSNKGRKHSDTCNQTISQMQPNSAELLLYCLSNILFFVLEYTHFFFRGSPIESARYTASGLPVRWARKSSCSSIWNVEEEHNKFVHYKL